MSSPALVIESLGATELGPCACCGATTRRVWGFVHGGEGTEAAYFVEWTPGAVARHGAFFDFILGRWGEEATPADRVAVTLELRHTERGPEFMVIDAAGRPPATSGLVGAALGRQAVLDSVYATRAFAAVDAVWLQEERIGELVAPAA